MFARFATLKDSMLTRRIRVLDQYDTPDSTRNDFTAMQAAFRLQSAYHATASRACLRGAQ